MLHICSPDPLEITLTRSLSFVVLKNVLILGASYGNSLPWTKQTSFITVVYYYSTNDVIMTSYQNIAPMTSSWRHIKTFIIRKINWSPFGKNWAKFKVTYSAHSQYWVNSIESLTFCKVECFFLHEFRSSCRICQSRQKSAHWTVKFWVISSGKCCLFDPTHSWKTKDGLI